MIIGLMTWQVAGRRITIYSISALTLIGFVGAWNPKLFLIFQPSFGTKCENLS